MNKTIRKFRPSDFWRIGEHESWFSEMASNGLHLKKVGISFAHFTKGEPRQMRYRIDVFNYKNITLEQKEMYSESGWDYVASYGLFNVFSSPDELNAPELHTDPAEQAYTLNYLDKKFTKSAIGIAVAIALMIGIFVALWFINSAHYLALVDGLIIQIAIMIIAELYVVYTSVQAAVSMHALRKTLSEGKPINHSAPWKMKYKVNLIVVSVIMILAICAVIHPIMQMTMRKTKALPISSIGLPIVRLADVEQNPELVPEQPAYNRNNIDWNSRYSYAWSIVSPLQIESDERGEVANELWNDGSGIYSPNISNWAYKINLPYINEGVLSDLINRYGEKFKGAVYVEMEHPDFDKLIVHEGDYFGKEVFAAKGKGVIYIRYQGNASINSLIEAVAEKIKLISD
ncbi:DUF2812 domain-containing protein [Clostridium sp.]|uniref:DUF2812 domain-containing protein n=1 Tax=Clostridium sp. TaxID=1506 RepID=UPI001A598A8F|nr:DUF2812 domain-containing protein [Clostridium sp.]MBK5236174.1 DUF2812 domain-containing protein [Clostridium sp.]